METVRTETLQAQGWEKWLPGSDSLGGTYFLVSERYPANSKHGCDRSKTLMDIVRAGIQALSDGSVVLPAPAFVRQPPFNVRHQLSDNWEERITEIIASKTEPLRAELEELKTSQAGVIEQAKAELRVELGELAA